MILLIAGLIVFLGAHSISIFARGWRNDMLSKLGEGGWKGLYALVSVVGFALIIYGYGNARLDPAVIYTPPTWIKHLAMLLLLPVFPLFLATYLDCKIKAVAKHPTLVATKIWALAHLLVNGTLADILLFGGFLAWAVADRISVKRRTDVVLPVAPVSWRNDIIALVGGVIIYGLFVKWGHVWLIGVSPI